MAWYLVYATSIILDQPDLLGVKQLYYNSLGLGVNTGVRRSPKLHRFLKHVPHGSFLGFNVLFWLRPDMTLDRLLLAVLMTAFMYLRWTPDRKDYEYQKRMWAIKSEQLSN